MTSCAYVFVVQRRRLPSWSLAECECWKCFRLQERRAQASGDFPIRAHCFLRRTAALHIQDHSGRERNVFWNTTGMSLLNCCNFYQNFFVEESCKSDFFFCVYIHRLERSQRSWKPTLTWLWRSAAAWSLWPVTEPAGSGDGCYRTLNILSYCQTDREQTSMERSCKDTKMPLLSKQKWENSCIWNCFIL